MHGEETETLVYTKKEQYMTLIGVVMAWMFDAADYLLITFLIVQIGAPSSLNFGNHTRGWLMGIQLLGTGIGGIIFGYLGDSIGRKRTLISVICMYSICTSLTAFIYNVAFLFIIRFFTGVGVGGVWALGASLISEIWPKEKRNVGIAITQAGWPLGELIAALMVTFIVTPFDKMNLSLGALPFEGWRICFLFGGGSIFSALFIHFFVPESKSWQTVKGQRKGEIQFRKKRIDLTVFKKLFSKDLIKIFLLGLTFGIAGMQTFYAINSWLPQYVQEFKTLKETALMIGLFWGTTGYIGHVLFGFISNEIGRKPTFIAYSLLVVISGVVLALWAKYTWGLWVGLGLFTFGCGYFSAFGAVFSEIYPTEVRSTAASISYNGARGFSLLAPVLVIVIGNLFGGMQWGILAGGFFVIASTVILFFLPTKEGQDIALVRTADVIIEMDLKKEKKI